VFGERPIIPTFTRNPGVGRPPGSSTDGVFVPVSGSPVRSPTSVRSPQSWPSPPPQTGSRLRSVSRKGTRAETNDPEIGRPVGRAVEAKPRGRPVGSKNKPRPVT